MKNLKKDLQAVNKELNVLVKKTESLLKAVGKLEKPKAVKKPKAKAVKKAAPATAADTVFKIIKRYRKGVGTAALTEKTGFNKRKIYNNVKILKKRGKIKSVGRGVYLKA